jgi:hypothetical protein
MSSSATKASILGELAVRLDWQPGVVAEALQVSGSERRDRRLDCGRNLVLPFFHEYIIVNIAAQQLMPDGWPTGTIRFGTVY